MERDWLEDVFFHDSEETLKRKNAQLVILMRKNPSCAQADEAIDWFERLPNCKWPEATDDMRVHLRVNLVSRLDLLHSHIPWSTRMTTMRPFITKAIECYFGGFVFKCIGRRFVNLHHLHFVIAGAVFKTTLTPIRVQLVHGVVQVQEPEAKIEAERRYLSRLLQPEFYEDLEVEWSKRKRVDDTSDEPSTSSSESDSDSHAKPTERARSVEHIKTTLKETEDANDDDSDAVFQLPGEIVSNTPEPPKRKFFRFNR